MTPTRRTFLAGLSVMAVAPALVACGSDEPEGASDTGGRRAGAGEETAFPATISTSSARRRSRRRRPGSSASG